MHAKIAIIVALEREVKPLIRNWHLVEREHGDRRFHFFEKNPVVLVCGGIGAEAARRAAEAVITLYRPELVVSAGFAGALDASLKVGDSFIPRRVLDAGDGSASETGAGGGILVSFSCVASAGQKAALGSAYGAQAVDMEAAAVSRAALAHGVRFACVKAISDDHNFDIPRMDLFLRDGQFNTTGFVAYVVGHPWLWPRVIRLARNSARAARTLCKLLEQYNQNPEFLENVPAGLHLTSKHKD
jgi:adenosylhomocysteine nucleosidase